jgi:precorrin-3B C17-methyltransferase
MAGPLLEMAGDIPVSIVPGVTAAQIAAARLGAPLMNDYITLSLSDLLTPREEVLSRARLAAASDMVVCLYNPTSKKRRPLFEEVCAILAGARPPQTPAGWVRSAGGPDEEVNLTTLGQLAGEDIDMRSIIIVGNSHTEIVGGKMVTRRGYGNKK